MKKRLVSIILCMAMTTSLLFGCGNSDNSSDKAAVEEDTSSNEVVDAPASADGATSISFWKWIPTEGLQIDTLMAAWNEEYPDISIDITHVGESNAYFE